MSIASALGLVVDDAVVLQNSNKLAVRLLPCDVLARVAPLSQQVAQFEIELAQWLAATESPVAALEPRAAPRAYERDGFVVTLWTYYAPVTAHGVAPADYAKALERLHAGMRKLDVATPHFTDRVADAQRLVASRDQTPALADADRELLGSTLRKPETNDRRPQRRGAVAARRAAPGQCARHEERAAVHRPRDVLPRARRVRPRPCARRGRRALSGRRSRPARRVPGPRSCDGRGVAVGCRRPVPERATLGPRAPEDHTQGSAVANARSRDAATGWSVG